MNKGLDEGMWEEATVTFGSGLQIEQTAFNFKGISILLPLEPLDSMRLQWFDWGCAVVFGPCWFQLQWSDYWKSRHINEEEFIPVYFGEGLTQNTLH